MAKQVKWTDSDFEWNKCANAEHINMIIAVPIATANGQEWEFPIKSNLWL